MKLVLATHNKGKSIEMKAILEKLLPSFTLLDLNHYPYYPEPEEIGTTMEDNAIIKVESAFNYTGLPCIADDGGLEVDALGGAPGVYSKRFGGEQLGFTEKIKLLLELLKDTENANRSAQYRCIMAVKLSRESGVELFSGTCAGSIAHQPSGIHGFGFDPVFFLSKYNCTMAELNPDIKNTISHRYKALCQAGEFLSKVEKNKL